MLKLQNAVQNGDSWSPAQLCWQQEELVGGLIIFLGTTSIVISWASTFLFLIMTG